MPNPQLIEYIKQAKATGKGYVEIRSDLLGAGWQTTDIDEALGMSVPRNASFVPPQQTTWRVSAFRFLIASAFFLTIGGLAYAYFTPQSYPWVTTLKNIFRSLKSDGFFSENQKNQPVQAGDNAVNLSETTQLNQQTSKSSQSQQKSFQDILAKVEKEAPIQYSSVSPGSPIPFSEVSADPKDPEAIAYIQFSFIMSARAMRDNKTMHVVGEEILDGKSTTVIEYSDTDGGVPFTVKAWIWNERGVPLKTKTTYYGFGGKVAVREAETSYSDYVFTKVSDATLQLLRDMGSGK